MFLQGVLSTLMLCSLDITQHSITMNELKKSGTLKFALEQSIQQKLSLLLESGVLHGISHHRLYVQLSHTELVQYAEYIMGLFAATNVHFHDCVILFDKAIC